MERATAGLPPPDIREKAADLLDLLGLIGLDSMVVDLDGRVLAVAAAEDDPEPCRPLGVIDGRVATRSAVDQRRLATALADLAAAAAGWRTVLPLGERFLVTLVRHAIDGRPVALLLTRDWANHHQACPACLMDAFDLTQREAALTVMLAGGRSVQAAADELGMAVATARTHLRHIFQKTGVHGQSALVALVAGCSYGRCPDPIRRSPSTTPSRVTAAHQRPGAHGA
jgi:DNA-binding CsgD family transcriptional regulator